MFAGQITARHFLNWSEKAEKFLNIRYSLSGLSGYLNKFLTKMVLGSPLGMALEKTTGIRSKFVILGTALVDTLKE